MAASTSTDFYNSENYTTSWRGRPHAFDMDWSFFPERASDINLPYGEKVEVYEDPRQTELYYRDIMRYTGPDAPSYEHEKKRDNVYSQARTNMRDYSWFTPTDPYKDDDYDTQFHDKDPRGYLTEQPWQEYRRQLDARFVQTDFKDDSDMSVPSQGIHPNTMYSNIRDSQNWLKARLKIFENSLENFHNGGVGNYPHMSDLFKANIEDTTVNPKMSWGEQEISTPHAMNISNYLHNGTKMWRENSVPDQHVKTATYGKLYSRQGFIPHESQLRILEDDTKFFKSKRGMSKNIVKMMSSQTDGSLATKILGENMFSFARDDAQKLKESKQLDQRSIALTKDIMSLLGYTRNELKQVRQLETSNRKAAEHVLAQLTNMATTVHKLPANVKLSLKNDLLHRKTVMPSDTTGDIAHRVNLNHKIKRQLENGITQTGAFPGDFIQKKALVRNEGKDKVSKENSIVKGSDHPNINFRGDGTLIQTKDKTKETASFKSLEFKQENKALSGVDNDFLNSIRTISQQQKRPEFLGLSIDDANIDNEFGENRYLDRKKGTLGTKYMTRYLEEDDRKKELLEVKSTIS